MTIPSTIYSQPREPRASGPQGDSINWGLPTQPANRDKTPPYYIDPRQYTPVNYGFNTGKLGTNTYSSWEKGKDKFNLQNYFDQLLPTSINLRNRALSDMFQRANTDMESVYAGQGVGQAVDTRAKGLDQIYGNAAARGMGQSGALNQALRQNELGYLGAAGQAQNAAHDMETKRKAGIYGEILGSNQADIDFYKYLNAGRDVATGRAGGTNISGLAGVTSGAAGAAAWLASGSGNPSTINYGNGVNAADPYTGNMNSIYNNPSGGQEDIYGTPSSGSSATGGNWLDNLF